MTTPEPPACGEDIGLGAGCGDDATTTRAGFPMCPAHARRHDALTRLDETTPTDV